eukprot:11210454-Lingulodinium_polyedra.AAC.1
MATNTTWPTHAHNMARCMANTRRITWQTHGKNMAKHTSQSWRGHGHTRAHAWQTTRPRMD